MDWNMVKIIDTVIFLCVLLSYICYRHNKTTMTRVNFLSALSILGLFLIASPFMVN